MIFVKSFLLTVSLFCLINMNANSQQPGKYETAWKRVEELVRKKLPQSALTEVRKIYRQAKTDKNDAQLIRSLVFIVELQSENRENNEILSIREFENEIRTGSKPAAAILNSLLAGQYWDYYQENRWDMYNRTKTVDFKNDDISTWSPEDFHKKIGSLYIESLSEEELLQRTPLAPYDAIIIKGNVRHLRPALFDLLAHRALTYFENDERDISQPAYAFEIREESAFAPAAVFAQAIFDTPDTSSLHFKALQLYQRILAFHLQDQKQDALVDADIQRIEFVYSNSVHPEKERLYIEALNQITARYPGLPAAAQAWYLLAAHYDQKASGYSPYGDTSDRYARVKAREICEMVLTQKDSSEGRINCYNLFNQINRPALQFTVEKVNVPDKPFRVFIKYRNLDKLHLRIIKPDEKLKSLLESPYDEKYWPAITQAISLRTWEQNLPQTYDFQQHAVEAKVDPLPTGEYLLVASEIDNLQDRKAILGARLFYVSNISFVSKGNDHFVLHRYTGKPLAGAKVNSWEQKYDYKKSAYILAKAGEYTTDQNGFFRKEPGSRDSDRPYQIPAYRLEISHEKDYLFMNELNRSYYYYTPDEQKTEEKKSRVFLFADRSIYRPGQTIFFKGIVLDRSAADKTNRVNTGFETTVYLRDANYQNRDSLTVKTNEFGSFSGKFTLPQSGLNGGFSIYTTSGDGIVQFQVEDYKRPKFYVEYEPVKGTFQVNDSIRITGTARGYAGNNIDGAKVVYRVTRQPRYLYPWIFGRGWFPPSRVMEITHGQVVTGTDGNFEIQFKAIPDLSVDKKWEPVFDYLIHADVTDINGETRSGDHTVSVGYKSLHITTSLPPALPVDSLKGISIRTENMQGVFEPSTVNVVISRLDEEKRLIRDRYWERPDQFVMNKQEYIQWFPHDEFDNETDPVSWKKSDVVLEKSDSLVENKDFSVAQTTFSPGHYQVEISTTDKSGEPVKYSKHLELYEEKSGKLFQPQYIWHKEASPVEPGEKTAVLLGSMANDLFVIRETEKQTAGEGAGEQRNEYSFLKLDNEKISFEFAVCETDRGGFGAGWFFVKHNRFFQYSQVIQVPWTNKELRIEYATYRDKTLPGSEEKWKLRISGYKNELVAAELLGSMYDASLDQFYGHQWKKPAIWPTFYSRKFWNTRPNFSQVESIIKEPAYTEWKSVEKNYDRLFAEDGSEFGLDYEGVIVRSMDPLRGKELMMKSSVPGAVTDMGLVSITSQEEKPEPDSVPSTVEDRKPESPPPGVQPRRDFNETAFFLPDLNTDEQGAIEFSFKMPEALTRWKFQALAHTREGALGYSNREIITQKQLMVLPNPPRFLREGDKMVFSAKIANQSALSLAGTAELQLVDAVTNQAVDDLFGNKTARQAFKLEAGKSDAVLFPIEIPTSFNHPLIWKVIAKTAESVDETGNIFSDGEENTLPVLTNRMLVTETMPLPVKGSGRKDFQFEKLKLSGSSSSLQHHRLTVEYTRNPAWLVVQALPYLMEYPFDCAEQIWNRYYGNSLATFIANSNPRIRKVFEQWSTKNAAALLSNLQKNPEIKSILLEETPWVLEARSEEEQRRNIALLFDLIRMNKELASSLEKLKDMQSENGGFVWFKGGPDNRYMTQYILSGIGHLKKLTGSRDPNLDEIILKAIPYLDQKIREDYDRLIKLKTDLKKYVPDRQIIQYLYMRTLFEEKPVVTASRNAYDYFLKQAKANWISQEKYMQGMIALTAWRTGDKTVAAAILKSLKETSVFSEETGRYWKDARRGWFWHEAPVERQSLLIEAFHEIGKDAETVDEMRTWLLKNKQTNRWESTRATAEACYALLMTGTGWLEEAPAVEISLGDRKIIPDSEEAGTGYIQQTLEGKEVTASMGNISVHVETTSPKAGENRLSWGAAYWQYFEDLDKISSAASPLQLSKKLFVETMGDRGPVIRPVIEGDKLKIGDKIKVRIELRVDRDMEFVHMKDMRASGLEPVNVLSGYRWQGGLGYYESTRDAGTHFFFDQLPKGTYVFEYPLFVTHAGWFSNGITSIQSMYAPEFAAHSEGIRIQVN